MVGPFDWPARRAAGPRRPRAAPAGSPERRASSTGWMLRLAMTSERGRPHSRAGARFWCPAWRPYGAKGGLEIVVVDQGEPPVDLPAGLADRVLRPGRNLGFAAGNQPGDRRGVRGEWIATVNDDVLVEPGWAAALVAALEADPKAAAAQGVNLLLDRPDLADGCGDRLEPLVAGGADRARASRLRGCRTPASRRSSGSRPRRRSSAGRRWRRGVQRRSSIPASAPTMRTSSWPAACAPPAGARCWFPRPAPATPAR